MHPKTIITESQITHSEVETRELAKSLVKGKKLPSLVCLYGDLGAGKTTFVRGLVEGWKLKARVQSPTFTYVRTYKGKPLVHHFDFYRSPINDPLLGAQVAEAIEDKDAVVICEWPELMELYLPKDNRINIYFSHGEADTRMISFSTYE